MNLLSRTAEKELTVTCDSDKFFEDLRVGMLTSAMSDNDCEITPETLLSFFTDNPEDIAYRSSIVRDVIGNADILASFRSVLLLIRQMKKNASFLPAKDRRRRTLSLYRLMRNFSRAAEILGKSLNGCGEALTELRERLVLQTENADYRKSLETLDRIDLSFLETSSVSIEIDCWQYNPASFVIQEFSDVKFDGDNFSRCKNPESAGLSKLWKVETGKYSLFEEKLLELYASRNKTEFDILERAVYQKTDCYAELISMERAFAFYVAAGNLYEKLKGSPVCFPKISKDGFIADFKGIYSLGLAVKGITPIANDICLDGRFYIFTGANNSGKTEFITAVSQAQLLFQCGMFVPCESAVMTPVSHMHTLFMGGEEAGYKDSRLGAELTQFKTIMEFIKGNKGTHICWLNEPMTGTSPDEGVQVCRDITEFLVKEDVKGMIVTHFYELFDMVSGEVGSIVMQVIEKDNDKAERTFKVMEDKPAHKSYAMEIAQRFGLDRESFLKRYRANGGKA